jgi:hypothetical protein
MKHPFQGETAGVEPIRLPPSRVGSNQFVDPHAERDCAMIQVLSV